jgi:hypothetical protein
MKQSGWEKTMFADAVIAVCCGMTILCTGVWTAYLVLPPGNFKWRKNLGGGQEN